MRKYCDWGRKIPGSRKEAYKIQDGEVKIYISKIWPQQDIKHMSNNRYMRWVFFCLRESLQSVCVAGDEQDAIDYINTIKMLKNELLSASNLERFLCIVRDYEPHLILKKDGICYEKMTYQKMEDSEFEVKPEKPRKKSKRIRTDFAENPGIITSNRVQKVLSERDLQRIFKMSGQFGNYVKQQLRRVVIPKTANALLDLCLAFEIEPESLGLKTSKNLAIAFGARGKGFAAGHFEPQEKVINLTKRTLLNGGVLAHEIAHAIDLFLGEKLGVNGYLTDNQTFGQLPEFEEIISFLNNPNTQFRKDALALDAYVGRDATNPYWASLKELWARSFNSTVIEILRQKGVRNDFLAFNFNDKIFKIGKHPVSANPKGEELQKLTEMFESLFEAMKRLRWVAPLSDESTLTIKKSLFTGSHSLNSQRYGKYGKQVAFF